MLEEILKELWKQLEPMLGEFIIIFITILLGRIGIPKLINAAINKLFSYIPYKPVEGMAWGLIRHIATKYPTLPGEEKAEKVFKEIKKFYPWFPSQKLLTVIKTQYRIWQGQLVEEKKRKVV